MSLYVGRAAPRRSPASSDIPARSSAPTLLAEEIRSRPPVLLVHGDADEIVPPSALPRAVSALEAAGVAVESVLCPGLAHGIDETGLKRGIAFLRRVLEPA